LVTSVGLIILLIPPTVLPIIIFLTFDVSATIHKLRILDSLSILQDMHWLRRSKSKSLSNESTHLMETAACLVNANQDVSFLANKDEISPLYLAVEAGNVSLVNAMLNSHVNNVQDKTFNLATQLKGRKSLVHAALKAKNTGAYQIKRSDFFTRRT